MCNSGTNAFIKALFGVMAKPFLFLSKTCFVDMSLTLPMTAGDGYRLAVGL